MITKPTLILDERKCRKNIAMMAEKAKENNVEFRPHFKTHQSLEIGRWFKEQGVSKITVSSLEMARYFSAEWNDITVAFPVNILEIETINSLAQQMQLNLLVESVDVIEFLKRNLNSKVGVFIKIDTGYHRTGIAPDDTSCIDEIIGTAGSDPLDFKGFLTHAGHTYRCRSQTEILDVHKSSVEDISRLRERYIERFPEIIISIGDTPSCSVAQDFWLVDEIRPGNFVFYDLSQEQIGACTFDQIAVALACPIVAVHESRKEIVIYGGGVHFSMERLEDKEFGNIFGRVVEKTENGWGDVIPEMYVKSLSQEHGIVSVLESRIGDHSIGDVLLVLPVHSCMTANLMKSYRTTNVKIIERL